MMDDNQVARDFERLLALAEEMTRDVDDEVVDILREAVQNPHPADEAEQVLTRVLQRLSERLRARGDLRTATVVDERGAELIREVVAARDRLARLNGSAGRGRRVALQTKHGVQVGPVFPTPTFHRRPVPMKQGFINVHDIDLWDGNERLEVHVEQFRQDRGRQPSADELLQIMLTQMSLRGLEGEEDQFKVVDLARSIASNGVRRPLVIDLDGTLLDGNRRLAACRYILQHEEFKAAEKARAEWVVAWQLTDHADDEDRRLVVTALNFEPDYKQDWPTYIKARKVFEEWHAMVALEHRPSPSRVREMKRELSEHFALGPDTTVVNRYIKMMEAAEEFEAYEVGEKGQDRHQVQHAASRHFEYFDELTKGIRPGGVAYALGQDKTFRHLVFDLLLQGKFRSYNRIRDLKHVSNYPDLVEKLREARDEPGLEEAQDTVDFALSMAASNSKERRELGANVRIKAFAEWLEGLPVSAFHEKINRVNLLRLERALRIVEPQVAAVLSKEPGEEL